MNQEKDGNRQELFYDTYALYAIATGEESYAEFVKGHKIITTLMNVYELYYTLLKDKNEVLAEQFFNKLSDCCIKLNKEIIKKAAKFRFDNIKKKFSYIGCLGYIVAKERKIEFLTGDGAFKGMADVNFVK